VADERLPFILRESRYPVQFVDSYAEMRPEGRLRDSKQKDSKSRSYRAREAGDELLYLYPTLEMGWIY